MQAPHQHQHQHRHQSPRRPSLPFESLRQFPVDSPESLEQFAPSQRQQQQRQPQPHRDRPDEMYHHNWEAFEPASAEHADDDASVELVAEAVNSHLDVYETVPHDLSNDIAVNALLARRGALGPLSADVELFDAADMAAVRDGRFAGEHRAQRSHSLSSAEGISP